MNALLWLAFLASAALTGSWFGRSGVPAAWLFGPMLVAIGFGVAGSELRFPRAAFIAAQGVIGCLLAHAVTPDFLRGLAHDWPGMAIAVAGTIAAGALVGFLVARYGSLPGSTAAWGSSVGAASAMVAMSEAHGADPRLVALMQYLRVLSVVLSAALISRHLPGGHPVAAGAAAAVAAAPFDAVGFTGTVAVAVFGAVLGRRLGLPAGALLVPLVAGAALNATGLVPIAPPAWLVALASAMLGSFVGLQFERSTFIRSIRAVPEILAASAAVIALCGGLAWMLSTLGGIDPLTAFLATTPGAIETVALLAIDGGADAAYVTATHTLRVLVVIAAGVPIARWIARRARRP